MRKKFFLSLLMLFLFTLSTASAAEKIDSETLLNDMRNNPKNYIYIGHASNAGDFIYVIKYLSTLKSIIRLSI